MSEQISLFSDNPEYDAFVDKFKPKKTTDDCYTPPEIYNVILGYVCRRWSVNADKVVRPFWPGGDYENYDYPQGAVVVDNPPFSILSKIIKYYLGNEIPFFLFCPSLTALSGGVDCNHIVCDCDITYENGAVVRTSFVTSFGSPNVIESCPELTRMVNEKMEEVLRGRKAQLPKYSYPDEIVTAAMVQRYSKYGIHFEVSKKDCVFVRRLDEQKEMKKAIYGGGLLLSEKKAAERAAAERAAAERAAAERAAAERAAAEMVSAHRWALSKREQSIVKGLP